MPYTPQHSATSGRWTKLLAVAAFAFGTLTIFSAGSVLFGPDDAREGAGDYVLFIVWFNFLAGFAYVVAAIGLWTKSGWAAHLATLIAAATVLAAIGFALVVFSGAAYEIRTIGALAIRFVFWATIAAIAHRALRAA